VTWPNLFEFYVGRISGGDLRTIDGVPLKIAVRLEANHADVIRGVVDKLEVARPRMGWRDANHGSD
jgi:hypothetical protein